MAHVQSVSAECLSNPNFKLLCPPTLIGAWLDAGQVKQEFEHKLNKLKKRRNTDLGGNAFFRPIAKEISKKIGTLTYSKVSKTTDRTALYDYFGFDTPACELCGDELLPDFEMAHIIMHTKGFEKACRRIKKYEKCGANYLFLCSNCHAKTERYWKKIKSGKTKQLTKIRKKLLRRIKTLKKKRVAKHRKLVADLKKDVRRLKKGERFIDSLEKVYSRFVAEGKRLEDKYDPRYKKLEEKLQKRIKRNPAKKSVAKRWYNKKTTLLDNQRWKLRDRLEMKAKKKIIQMTKKFKV